MEKNKNQLDRLLSKGNKNILLDKLIEYKRFLGVFPGLGIGVGAVLMFIYCFFYINYIPSQLSFSDSLSYIFISLGFGVLYLFFLFFNLFLVFCFYHKRFLGKNEWVLYLFGVIFIPILLFFCFLIFGFNYKILILLIFYYLIIYIFLKSFHKLSSGVVFLFFTLLSLYPLFIDGVFDAFLDKTLSRLSIKTDNASISLADEDFLFIRKIANEQGISLKTSCNLFDRSKLIHDVNILWSIGKDSLIEISGKANEENRKIRLTVNNENMKSIKISSPRKCIFKEFRYIKYGEFNKIKDFISRYELDEISKIRFYVFLESKPYKGVKNKNLFKDLADSIVENLPLNIQSDILSFKELTTLEYAQYCRENILGSYELKDCDSINKGIILELELKNKVQKNSELDKGWFKFERLFKSM